MATTVHPRVRNHPAGESLIAALQEAIVASIDLRGNAINAMRTVFSSPRLFNAYSEHQRRWVAEVAEVIAERIGTSTTSDHRPHLWSTITFAIATSVSYRVAMDEQPESLAEAMREAFGQAAALFDPSLDIGEVPSETD